MIQVEGMLPWTRLIIVVSLGTAWQGNLFKYWMSIVKKSRDKELGIVCRCKAQGWHLNLTPVFVLFPHHPTSIMLPYRTLKSGSSLPMSPCYFMLWHSSDCSFHNLDFSSHLNNSILNFQDTTLSIISSFKKPCLDPSLDLYLSFTFPQYSGVLSTCCIEILVWSCLSYQVVSSTIFHCLFWNS